MINWKNILERAAWTFLEAFLVALPATISMDMTGEVWKSALLGAALQLSDPAKEEQVQKFVTLGQYISLSGDPVFTENYVESMFFKTAE